MSRHLCPRRSMQIGTTMLAVACRAHSLHRATTRPTRAIDNGPHLLRRCRNGEEQREGRVKHDRRTWARLWPYVRLLCAQPSYFLLNKRRDSKASTSLDKHEHTTYAKELEETKNYNHTPILTRNTHKRAGKTRLGPNRFWKDLIIVGTEDIPLGSTRSLWRKTTYSI